MAIASSFNDDFMINSFTLSWKCEQSLHYKTSWNKKGEHGKKCAAGIFNERNGVRNSFYGLHTDAFHKRLY